MLHDFLFQSVVFCTAHSIRSRCVFTNFVTARLCASGEYVCDAITEELKRRDMFEWVGRRNNLKHRVREIIYHDYIYI
ncbi:MAG: TnpV protein [Firmicutes bacterium]|nr:TnpV protein [Bacillota bacterium]